METGFNNPISPKIKKKIQRSPWNHDCPQHDESTSCFVNAGTHYGIGFNNPVGKKQITKSYSEVIPVGRVKTLQLYPDSRNAEIEEG